MEHWARNPLMEPLLMKIAYCRPVTLLKKVSVTNYRFLISKVVPKDYFCIRNLERFSRRIYWQFFLKLLLCITKTAGNNNIQKNPNHNSKKQASPKHYKHLSFYSSYFPWQVSIVTLQPTYLHFLNKDRGNAK